MLIEVKDKRLEATFRVFMDACLNASRTAQQHISAGDLKHWDIEEIRQSGLTPF